MRNIIFTLILLIATSYSKLDAQDAEHKIMFSNHYPPFNYLNEDGQLVGFNIDLFNSIKKLYDLDVSIENAHWSEINKALENGEINAIGGAHYPGIQDPNYLYTRSTISTSHCFIYNENYINKLTLEDLRSYRSPLIAMWKNDVLKHYILSVNPSSQFIYVTSYNDLINKLKDKNVTCIFSQRIGGLYYANKQNIENVKTIDIRILERNMGFKISKNSPKLAKTINNGLEVILANGEYQRIYDKWISVYDEDENLWDRYLKYILFAGALVALIIAVLIIVNWVLQKKIKNKTKDLIHQLQLNSEIMKELENQKVKAEDSDKMKSTFLANMSHEIRTPMNGILGFADLLKSEGLTSEKRGEYAEIVKYSSNQLLTLINDIIDVSKIEAGEMNLTYSRCNLDKLINNLKLTFEEIKVQKGKDDINFITDIPKNAKDLTIKTDPVRLHQILSNLLNNSLKFSEKGNIEFGFKIKNKDCIKFFVKDQGIGIPKEKIDVIFKRFEQLDQENNPKNDGTGLGLSITKGIIELMNGTFEIESKINKGTTFTFTIPLNEIDTKQVNSQIENDGSKEIDLNSLKILFVEDDPINISYFNAIFENYTCELFCALNGKEAVALYEKHPDIDIILMDIRMPVMDGKEAARLILKKNPNAKIIAQTAFAMADDKEKFLKMGFVDYIAKPINRFDLKQKITNNLSLGKSFK